MNRQMRKRTEDIVIAAATWAVTLALVGAGTAVTLTAFTKTNTVQQALAIVGGGLMIAISGAGIMVSIAATRAIDKERAKGGAN